MPSASTKYTFGKYWRLRYPEYELAPHVELLIRFLEGLQPGDLAIINMPPRHGKSETVKAFVEYSLGRASEEGYNVMYTSYTAHLAYKASRSIRNAVAYGSAFRKAFPDTQLAKDAKAVQAWSLENGNGLMAAGVGGSITGMGASLIVLDDPIKGRRQAESTTIREGTMDWIKADLLTRASPSAIVILIQTRWHKYDPSGAIEEEALAEGGRFGSFRVRKINLPALAEAGEPDALNRKPGEALWPGRWPTAKLEANRKTLGAYDWASLYQQRPYVKGGTIFNQAPTRYEVVSLEGARLLGAIDTASSKRKTADYTAIAIAAAWGDAQSGHVKLLEVRRGRMDLLELDQVVAELEQRYGVTFIIEETAQSQPIITYLRSQGRAVKGQQPFGDKFTRAGPLAAAWNRGAWQLPQQAPWLSDYLNEHTEFTGTDSDAHDDQVDVSSMLWNSLMNRSLQIFA